jgi:ABC-2 type transport system permease protein
MIAVLVRLQWMTLKGRVVRSIRLLRQPKYLVGSIVGFAWMALWVIRPLLRSNVHYQAMPLAQAGGSSMPAIHLVAALAVTLLLPLPWLLPWGRLGLPFRESELTMLLQAPLSRRQVIQYGLLKSEVGVVFSALVLSLVVGRGDPLTRLSSFLGTWILFEFWHVNGKWRALFNLRQTEVPIVVARRRRSLLTIGLLGFYVALGSALMPFLAQVSAAFRGADRAAVVTSLTALTWPPLLVGLLTPAWWLTAPMLAADRTAFLVAVVPTALLVLVQREVVLRSKARFEESALAHAKAQETSKSPTRRFTTLSSRARSNRPFELERHGQPEIAVVWKNAMRVSRMRWTRVAFVGLALLVAIAVLPAVLRLHDVTYAVLATVGASLMIVLPLIGGMAWNNDLRTELAHIELVRTWPISANGFVLAEVASPALMSFAGSTFGAAMVLTSLLGSRLRHAWTGDPARLVLLPRDGSIMGVDNELAAVLLFASVLPLSAAASFFSSALQNLAVILVPAWMAQSVDRSQGVAAFGQRMVFSVALGLSFMLALVPSVLLVGAAVLAQGMLGIPWSAWECPVWALLGAVPLFLGGLFIVRVAAPLWERLDPSQEILELGR